MTPGAPILAAVLVQGAGSAALLVLPQFGHLGHFHSLGATVLFVLGPAVLVALGWRRRGVSDLLEALPGAWLALVAATLAPVVVAELVGGGCRDPLGSADFLLTHGLAVLIGLALAAAASRLGRGWHLGLAWAGLLAVSTVWALLPLYTGPQVFVLHPLLGLFPGPIYDRLYEIPPRYLLDRAFGLAGAWAVLLSLRARAERSPRLAAAALALGLAVLASFGAGARLGLRVDDGALARSLPAERTWQGLTVRFDARASSPALLEAAWDDACFAYQEAQSALGLPPTSPATLHVFPSDAERGRLLGTYRVSVSKPWRGAAYLSLGSWDRCTVKHELLHALLGPRAGGWLGVPWTGGLPNLGLVEGVAEAFTDCAEGFPVHGQARRMLDEGALPAPADLISPARFWTLPGRRAYAAAASFVGFLHRSRGAAAVLAAYRDGDVAGAAGVSLAALDEEWRRWLGREVTLSAEEQALLAEHLSQRSVFTDRCSQERARAAARTARAVACGDWRRVLAGLDEANLMAGRDVDPLLRVRALVVAGRPAEARTLVSGLLASGPPMPLAFWARLAEADLVALEGREDEAREAWEALRRSVQAPALRRQAAARPVLFSEPPLPREALADAILFPATGPRARAAWGRLEEAGSADPRVAWLTARRHLAAGRAAEGLAELAKVPGDWPPGEGHDELRDELLRLRAQAAYRAGRFEESRGAWSMVLARAKGPVERRAPEEWLRRISRRAWR